MKAVPPKEGLLERARKKPRPELPPKETHRGKNVRANAVRHVQSFSSFVAVSGFFSSGGDMSSRPRSLGRNDRKEGRRGGRSVKIVNNNSVGKGGEERKRRVLRTGRGKLRCHREKMGKPWWLGPLPMQTAEHRPARKRHKRGGRGGGRKRGFGCG